MLKPTPLSMWLLAVCTAIQTSFATMLPFVPPWDKRPANLTDFGQTLHKPAGALGRIHISGEGHYLAGEQRMRFFGANIGAASAFPPKSMAAGVAQRYASLGFNVVRFHHMDNGWTTSLINYKDQRSNELNPEVLDRLDWFVAQLKQEGVYINFNLLNSRVFAARDGLGPEVASMEWKDQAMLGFFHDGARNLQKEYAQRLLTHVNPYTGLAYADDPAIAFVEVNNEIGLLHMWFAGSVDRLPNRYRSALQNRWNSWLAERYGDDESLHEAWGSVDQPLGPNRIANGDFSGGTQGWNLEQHQGAQASFTVIPAPGGQQIARVQTTKPGAAGWHVQFNQAGIELKQGQIYTLSYRVRGTDGRRIHASLMQAYDPWQGLDYQQQITLTGTWQQVSGTFIARSTDSRVRLNFGNLGANAGVLEIAGVSLREGGTLGFFPGGTSLSNRNIPTPRRDNPGTVTAARDWLRFLYDTEAAYWIDMRSWIAALGYQGIQWGTTIMNSPPGIQSAFPAIDSHAYWNHPMFHGNDWDPENWTVDATAMVNSRSGGVISDLAWQRVRGRPHNVTEYQHSSPNPYGGDAALFAAVYGSFQDWDGIYLFHYGSGSSDWNRGYFNGYFDIDQHPAHRVNAAIAALLFRRFDVAPGQHLVAPGFDRQDEFEVIEQSGRAWHVGDIRHLNPGTLLPLVHRVAMDLHPDPQNTTPEAPPLSAGSAIISDTGQITWDQTDPDRGWLTVNAPRVKAMWGFTDGRSKDFGGLVIAVQGSRTGWSTCSVILTEGEGFHALKSGGRGLVATTGMVENTAMRWKDDSRTSVGNQWGRAPVLAEAVRNAITFGVPASRLQVWALDPDGNRAQPWEVRPAGENSWILTGGSGGSLWYEFEIIP